MSSVFWGGLLKSWLFQVRRAASARFLPWPGAPEGVSPGDAARPGGSDDAPGMEGASVFARGLFLISTLCEDGAE